MAPVLSVCIPAYNNAAYIKETIEAVLKQDCEDFELVVIDDCSSDNTAEVVETVKDPRIRLVRNEKNLGMTGNWNKCIEEAAGEYVKLICADDILYEGSLRKEKTALDENPDVNLVMSDTALIDMSGKKVGSFKRWPVNGKMDGRKLAKISLLFNNFFGAPCNNMFRKTAAVRAGGFDKQFTYILDFDFWVSLACLGKVFIIHETLNGFRIREDSNTGEVMGSGKKGDVYVAEHEALVKKHACAGKIHMGKAGIAFSVWFRKVRSRIIHMYLKLVNGRKQ